MKNSSITFFGALALVGFSFIMGSSIAATRTGERLAAAATLALPEQDIEARAAILFDPNSGEILYQKNAQEQLPLASLTKLMAAYAILSSINPDTKVRIAKEDLYPEGDWGLKEGDMVSVRDLLRMGLVASCNDCLAAATRSLGDQYLVAMNASARQLALTRTYFLNPTGLDLSFETAGAYGSAFDVARLASALYARFPEYFELSTRPTVDVVVGDRLLSFPATTVPIQDLPGFVGAKTGYTDLAGGNLAAIVDLAIGRPVVAVVLNSSHEGRFNDVRKLIEAARLQQL